MPPAPPHKAHVDQHYPISYIHFKIMTMLHRHIAARSTPPHLSKVAGEFLTAVAHMPLGAVGHLVFDKVKQLFVVVGVDSNECEDECTSWVI